MASFLGVHGEAIQELLVNVALKSSAGSESISLKMLVFRVIYDSPNLNIIVHEKPSSLSSQLAVEHELADRAGPIRFTNIYRIQNIFLCMSDKFNFWSSLGFAYLSSSSEQDATEEL